MWCESVRILSMDKIFRFTNTLGCFTLRLVTGCSLFPVTICITACQSGLFETSYRLFHCFLLPAASQHASQGCFTLRLVTGCSLFSVIICITACQSELFHIETSYRLFHCFLLPSASQRASLGCLRLVTGCSIVSCYQLHHSMPVWAVSL